MLCGRALVMLIDDLGDFDVHRLQSLFDKSLGRMDRQPWPILVSMTVQVSPCDPFLFFQSGARISDDRLLLACPGGDYTIMGIGVAWSLSLQGPRRFADAAVAWRELISNALISAPAPSLTGPVLMGGFSFDPMRPHAKLWEGYLDGRLVLPRYQLTNVNGMSWLTVNAVLWPTSDLTAEIYEALSMASILLAEGPEGKARTPRHAILTVRDVMPAPEWKALVRGITHDMRRGDVEKVVLARECCVDAHDEFDPSLVLWRLREDYPNCFIFAIARGIRCFLGATPERLVRLRDGEVRTMALAGSIARGVTENEDRRLGEALLASTKDRGEHAVVVDALRNGLARMCAGTLESRGPILMKVHNVQHL